MAAPGDLIVTADDSSLGPLFVECWNTYTLKENLLGSPLDTVPERVMDAVLEYENQPEFCPEWAMLPRPLAENDPRIFFRELELEVAYTFSSQADSAKVADATTAGSVSQIMEAFEAPALKQLCSSPARLQEMIRTAVPGTHWKKFDRDKGGRIIIEAGHPGYIYKAGDQWKTFDYVNGWLALETSMKKGARFRGKAFENAKWRKALRKMWQAA